MHQRNTVFNKTEGPGGCKAQQQKKGPGGCILHQRKIFKHREGPVGGPPADGNPAWRYPAASPTSRREKPWESWKERQRFGTHQRKKYIFSCKVSLKWARHPLQTGSVSVFWQNYCGISSSKGIHGDSLSVDSGQVPSSMRSHRSCL